MSECLLTHERLKGKAEGSTRLTYTWLRGELEPKDKDEVNGGEGWDSDG
jgi:hypothetical protein